MKNLSLALGLVFLCSNVWADNYVTKRGAIFTSINDPSFGTTWKDPSGLIWSQYQGNFANFGTLGSTPVNETGDRAVIDSSAERACQTIAGHLPSLQQFRNFFENFETTNDFNAIFPVPTTANHLFWTSTALNEDFVRFVKASPILDPFGDVANSKRLLSVLCVH